MSQVGQTPTTTTDASMIPVWDRLVRVFHWSTVTLFLLAYLIEEPEVLHEILGYTLVGILAVRVIWGFIGSKYARFTNFVPSPRRLTAYLKAMRAGNEARFVGHNPAGGAMVLALMGALAMIGLSGWMIGAERFAGAGWTEDFHEIWVNMAIILVVLHVGGVVLAGRRHHENLVRAMWTGKKRRD